MDPNLLRLAADKLPRCVTLADAEKVLGGEWKGDRTEWRRRVHTWGLFDGFRGRPVTSSGIDKAYHPDYYIALKEGRRLRRSPAPKTP